MSQGQIRQRQRRPRERPSEIAEAALDLFTKLGYAGTSIDAIADAAGVTKGAVYHHFGSKEDLLRAAVDLCFQRAFDPIDDSLRGLEKGSAIERIQAILRGGWNLWCSGEFAGIFHLAFFDPGNGVPGIKDTFLQRGPHRGWAYISAEIAAGQRKGEIRADLDPEATARFVASGLAFQALLLNKDRAMKKRDKDELLEQGLENVASILALPQNRKSNQRGVKVNKRSSTG